MYEPILFGQYIFLIDHNSSCGLIDEAILGTKSYIYFSITIEVYYSTITLRGLIQNTSNNEVIRYLTCICITHGMVIQIFVKAI